MLVVQRRWDYWEKLTYKQKNDNETGHNPQLILWPIVKISGHNIKFESIDQKPLFFSNSSNLPKLITQNITDAIKNWYDRLVRSEYAISSWSHAPNSRNPFSDCSKVHFSDFWIIQHEYYNRQSMQTISFNQNTQENGQKAYFWLFGSFKKAFLW